VDQTHDLQMYRCMEWNFSLTLSQLS